MLLPVLPESVRLDLTDAGFAGLVAVYRPMDVLDKSRWFDECSLKVASVEAQAFAVRRQLLTIEGVEIQNADGSKVAFDPKNDAHFRVLPIDVVTSVFTAIITRTSLTEGERKN